MGIPSFASRMRGYGSLEVLGRTGESQSDCAIIDGPSLAHSLLQQTASTFRSDDDAIMPTYDYSAMGGAAIRWLKDLERYGFQIDAIYFDGALPEHKKETRLQRLQAYTDKLVVFKSVHDELAKAAKNARSGITCKQMETQLEKAHRSLPPPPFLVFAVVEALLDSVYGDRTFAVDGEADELCAAKAVNVSLTRDCSQVSIFTNDSDLMLFDFDRNVRIINIGEMSSNEDHSALTGLQHYPYNLRNVSSNNEDASLVRPAFLMKLDPHLPFRNAVSNAEKDPERFSNSDFEEFAEMYDTADALEKLGRIGLRGHSLPAKLDSRISEVLCKARLERDRIAQTREWYATQDARTLQRMKTDLVIGWHIDGKREVSDAFDSHDFAYSQQDEDLKPADLDLFLPVLFDDPARATAWKIGSDVREVAMHLAGIQCGIAATVFEYKRAGQRIRGTAFEPISPDLCNQRLGAWAGKWSTELERLSIIGDDWRWKLVLTRLLLDDTVAQDASLPSRQTVLSLLQHTPATDWNTVHLHAQYQAIYYSLRMLMQVLRFVTSDEEAMEGNAECQGAFHVLSDLPTIAAFCKAQNVDDESACGAAIERIMNDYNLQDDTIKTTETRARKRSKGARKKRQKIEKQQNVFASLEDAEDA